MALALSSSCATMRLGPLQVLKSGNSQSLAMTRTGNDVARSRWLIVAGTRLPGVTRWEAKGLRAPPLLPKPQEMAWRGEKQPLKKLDVVCSLPVSAASSVQIANTMFTFGTAFVLPVYTAMIFAPKWKWTKKIVESDLPFLVMSVMYVFLLALSWTPETAGLLFASKYYLPELPGITGMFSSTVTVASAWLHLLAVDLFCGRTVFLDGLQHEVETRHSLVLCLMMCPVGLISHCVTKAIMYISRRLDRREESTRDMGKSLGAVRASN